MFNLSMEERLSTRDEPISTRRGAVTELVRAVVIVLCLTGFWLLAGCAEILHDTVSEIKNFANMVDDSPGNDQRLANQGYEAIRAENYRDAETYLDAALQANPSNPYALLNLGVVYERTGRIDQARGMYARVILLDPPHVADASNGEGVIGLTLADIARQNLRELNDYPSETPDPPAPLADGGARLAIMRHLLESQLITDAEYNARAPSAGDPLLSLDQRLPSSEQVAQRLVSLRAYRQTELIPATAYVTERTALLDSILPVAPFEVQPPKPAPAAEPIPTPDPETPAATDPSYKVHIASYRTEDAALAGWEDAKAANPDLLGALGPVLATVDLGPGQGIFIQVQAGPVESKTAAEELCTALKLRDLYCVPTI
jgi:tetratricopeptide (TPR) repeat protein